MNTKNEYIHRMTEMINAIDSTQETLRKQKEELEKLKNEYANKFRKFKPGTKVKITTPTHKAFLVFTGVYEIVPEKTRYGFVDHNEVLEDFTIKPVLLMCKKDGTISKKRLYYGQKDVITATDNE